MTERDLNERVAAVRDDVLVAKDRALEAAHDYGDRIQRSASELGDRARHYGAAGADYARRAGSSTASFAADNALPLGLIGLGVGWLVLSARRNNALRDEELYIGAEREQGYERETRTRALASSVQERAGALASDVQERAGALASRAREASNQLATRVGEGYDSARNRAGEVASQVGQQASQWSHDARDGITHAGQRTVEYMDENPLLVGALAIAAGVGVGLALPETRRENQLLGETRDRLLGDARGLLDEARRTARDVGETAREAARDVQRQARETTQDLRGAVSDPRISH
ncbi:MAG TPA: hypothetical protein VFX59_18970 [Polyangiales bacterium]|nr:hypothetical protein [Polyangiales bacterium]